jgi:hypothetical protein
LKTKYLSLVLLIVIAAQLITVYSAFNINHSSQSDNPSISNLIGNDELLPNIYKQTRKVIEQKIESGITHNEGAFSSRKGNSLFDFYNQILPKTLSLSKINSSFFTVYFSTAV